ncbi:MAG: sugar-binding protein [Eubacteriales bacterium]|nr:sugar-binding protein [Eubacteriales bacterium]
MKKAISLFIAVMIIVMLAVPAAAFSENQSYGSVGKTPVEPAVDGVKDEVYDYGLALRVNRVLGGELAAEGTAYLLYSDTYLYVFVDVKDSTDVYIDGADAWNADCVEVLFDWDDSGTVQQYRLNSASEPTGDKTEERDWSAAAVKNDSGYTAEFRFDPRKRISIRHAPFLARQGRRQ